MRPRLRRQSHVESHSDDSDDGQAPRTRSPDAMYVDESDSDDDGRQGSSHNEESGVPPLSEVSRDEHSQAENEGDEAEEQTTAKQDSSETAADLERKWSRWLQRASMDIVVEVLQMALFVSQSYKPEQHENLKTKLKEVSKCCYEEEVWMDDDNKELIQRIDSLIFKGTTTNEIHTLEVAVHESSLRMLAATRSGPEPHVCLHS